MWIARELADLLKVALKTIAFIYLPFALVMTYFHYPYDTDPSMSPGSAQANAQKAGKGRDADFYTVAYQGNTDSKRGMDYETVAREAAERDRIEDKIRAFVKKYNLSDKKVLEVGSGRGYLQDMVADYTGLDLSESVRRFYHKPLVVGSATKMPFPDHSFDAIWTVWVMEHIPEPERALREMRRVLKPGGVIFLYVAWLCDPFLAEGFAERPYSDFNWRGKLVKATVPIQRSLPFKMAKMYPVRSVRWFEYSLNKSQPLRFQALNPNYDVYWEPDSDAVIGLDNYETMLWFRSQGDRCLNCDSDFSEIFGIRNPLIIQVN